ncbi:hypothetical protein FQN60_009390, partial [Etheostoma spectabile]
MDDNPARREAARPRRRASAAAEVGGANVSLQDGEGLEVLSARETQAGPDRPSAAGGRTERRNSGPQVVHQRHMPMEPLKFHIPRKTKEKRALFQHVSTESREYEDMMTILTSSYIDAGSAGCFTYCKPRLVHSELLEKEFVEKRKEMKADGRTDKELEESYCFLLADSVKLPCVCEKGLLVGQSWITLLGHPSKGVYLSRYSDLLQINPLNVGATGEVIIFKVMKGKVKSIYENMKNVLDPTPRFDSHISKNASKVTSLASYRSFELTQQYFYEYSFDELLQRPRQVCPYAVVSFQFKGKDSSLPSKPLTPIRPEKLEIGWLMKLDQVTTLLPSDLLSYNLYTSSQEVVKNGHCSSLLEVTDRSRSTTSVTRLLQELEINRVVLVTQLTDRGFLFLISSVQMATPSERGESWKRCLQALFVFPESRDVSTLRCASSSHDASESLMSGGMVMPRLNQFIPVLHHALVKARANPPPELSAGIRQYPMSEYDSKLDERGKLFPAPKHHRVNMDGYLRSYLYNPALYLLSVARARQMVEAQCGPEELQDVRLRKGWGGQREATGKEATSNARDKQANTQKMQQLVDLVLTCKRNAENEVRREEGGGGVKVPGRKRKMEQETAERALKFLKASQDPGRHGKIPVEGSQVPGSPGSLASVIGSVGLKDFDLREDGSELAASLLSLLTGERPIKVLVKCKRRGRGNPVHLISWPPSLVCPPTTAGSISSSEGFSPSSHSGEMSRHGAAGREEEEEEEAKRGEQQVTKRTTTWGRSLGFSSPLQVCVHRGTPRETETSPRTLASSTSPQQRASPQQPNLAGRAPPHLLSKAFLLPPSSAHPLSPALLTPPPNAPHPTPAL